MDNLCYTCKYAEFDYNESGHFVDGCRKSYPVGSEENKWGEVIKCPEYKDDNLYLDDIIICHNDLPFETRNTETKQNKGTFPKVSEISLDVVFSVKEFDF